MNLERRDPHRIVHTSLGDIVLPDDPPPGGFIFWTTSDFDGRLDPRSVELILTTVDEVGGEVSRFETCQQVHGISSVEVMGEKAGWSECSDCDALWTRRPGVALGIKIADCLPVSIIDPTGEGVVINLHAGWRGAAAGIVSETIRAANGAKPALSQDAHAWLGPSIRVCCFEVGEEVVEAFRATHAWVDDFVDRSRDKPHLDLAGLVKRTLIDEGIAENRIWDGGLCTRCPESRFHSYRRSGSRAGRNLAVVGR